MSKPSPPEPAPALSAPALPAGPAAPPRWPAWATTLGRQWWHLQGIKVLGICGFMVLFFQGYFHVLKNPVNPVTPMPLTVVDGWIPFTPAAFWPYVSLWVYVGIAPALQPSMAALLRYGAWITTLCVIGLLCFYLWPTAVPSQAHQLDPAVADHPGFALMRGLDAAGNACPSLHVATATFTAMWLHRLLADAGAPALLRVLNLLWLAAIAWSTVAVRQHVVLDVVAGAALGLILAGLSLRFTPREAPMAQPVSSAPI